MLEIINFVLGPVATNVFMIASTAEREAVVVDPAWDGHLIAVEAQKRSWKISQIWITHAHFDHIAGTTALLQKTDPIPTVALHSADLPLWQKQGGASFFGVRIEPIPDPGVILSDGQILGLGDEKFEVRHAPGHTPGHVIFYCTAEKLVFCGDVIFQNGIGRTDLPGGSFPQLLNSIQTQILSLPDDTRLLSGHGPETTVGEERRNNLFLFI